MIDAISKLSPTIVLGCVGIIALFLLLIPVALKIAGLTGQQITDTLALTMQFFVNIVREFRAQNKQP